MTVPRRAPNIPPFLGNALSFSFSPNTFLLNLAKRYGDVVGFDLMGSDTYLLAHPEAIHDVLIRKKHAFIKSLRSRRILGKSIGTGLSTSIDDYHTRQRRLVQPNFHTVRLPGYFHAIVGLTQKHVDGWQANTVYSISDEMMSLTGNIVSKILFGNHVTEDALAIGHAIEVLLTDANTRLTNPVAAVIRQHLKAGQKEIDEARATVDTGMMRFIADRRARGMSEAGDLLSMLLLSTDENGDHMTDREVRDEIVTLFANGHQATSSLLTWTWYVLSQHPDIKHKIHDEIKTVLDDRPPTLEDLRGLTYTTMLLKEVLRYYPPIWLLITRTSIEDVEVGGFKIPDYANVLIAPYVMHRNLRWWDDVHTFNPERFTPENEGKLHPYQYIPFGAGEHMCIGDKFAMMIAQLVLVMIARSFDLQLAMQMTIKEKAATTLMPRDDLMMRVIPRT